MAASTTNNTILAYQNLFAGEAVVPSDGVAAQAINWTNFDAWEPVVAAAGFENFTLAKSATADVFCFTGNLKGCTIELRENGAVLATIDTTDPVQVVPFASHTGGTWEVRVLNGTGAAITPEIEMVLAGVALPISDQELGFNAPRMSHVAELVTNKNSKGKFIGRSLREQGQAFEIINRPMSEADAYDLWAPFIEHALRRTFFFYQDLGGREDHAFVWTDGVPNPPSYIKEATLEARLKVIGVAA